MERLELEGTQTFYESVMTDEKTKNKNFWAGFNQGKKFAKKQVRRRLWTLFIIVSATVVVGIQLVSVMIAVRVLTA